jgi:hypothetical protein
MRIISRIWKVDPAFAGAEQWFWGLALVAVLIGWSLSVSAPPPSPDLMRDIGSVGIVLVLAFVVEATWLVPRLLTGNADQDRESLGVLTSMAAMGLVGVVVALLLAAHLEAGHGNLLDYFGLAWTIQSLAVLGSMIVMQPWLSYESHSP